METGTILMFYGATAPAGYYFLDGSELDRVADAALFAIFGETYNAPTTPPDKFLLPDLGGRMPIGANVTYPNLTLGGEATVALTVSQLPAHTHALMASEETNGVWDSPNNRYLASGQIDRSTGDPLDKTFHDGGTLVSMNAGSIGSTGAGAGHNNIPPYFAIRYIVKN
jgi:microcystin-dependent protein